MPLDCGGNNNTNYVDIGATTSLANLDPWTFFFIAIANTINSGTINNGRLFDKLGASTEGSQVRLNTGGSATQIDSFQGRATADSNPRTNDKPLIVGQISCIAVTFQSSASPATHIYTGRADVPLVESTYGITDTGSGAIKDSSAVSLRLLNAAAANRGWVGPAFIAAFWNSAMNLGELRELQKDPRPYGLCRGFWRLGTNGTGLVYDESGFNNHGTITGAIPTNDYLPRMGR